MITVLLFACSDYSITHKVTREIQEDTGYTDGLQSYIHNREYR